MFREAHRSSSGTLTVFAASGLHTHVVTGRSHVRLDYTCVSESETAKTVIAPDDERCAARNMLSR
jgi:dolichol kinase